MREIEVLVELKTDVNQAHEILEKFDYKGNKQTIDTYYADSLRKNLQLNENNKLMECCRLREKGGKFYVTYKSDNYNGDVWLYSDEYETEVKDIIAMEKIFESLGLQKLVVVNNIKHVFETPDFEIVLEEVENLGCFLESEALNDDENISVESIKSKIYKFIADLGLDIGDELNSGKPELLLIHNQKISQK